MIQKIRCSDNSLALIFYRVFFNIYIDVQYLYLASLFPPCESNLLFLIINTRKFT